MKILFCLVLILAGARAAAADTQDPDVLAVFDRSKGKIYALYGRELRDNPRLAGKIVFD